MKTFLFVIAWFYLASVSPMFAMVVLMLCGIQGAIEKLNEKREIEAAAIEELREEIRQLRMGDHNG